MLFCYNISKMFYINKIIGWAISPVGVALAGFAAAGLLCRLQRRKGDAWRKGLPRRIARVALWTSVAWLWLWSTPLMVHVVGAPLEREFLQEGCVPAIESFPQADAIVLLGGSMMGATNVTRYGEMSMSADRVWQAARLWKAGKAPRIVATGTGCVESTSRVLADFGIPDEAITFADSPRNTEEEARLLAKQLVEGRTAEAGKPKILLVTSAWHMKRARMMFVTYAPELDVVPAPADFENTVATADGVKLLDLFPNPQHFLFNSIAFHEWLGILGYKILR